MPKVTAAALKKALNAAGAARLKHPVTSAPSAARHVARTKAARTDESLRTG